MKSGYIRTFDMCMSSLDATSQYPSASSSATASCTTAAPTSVVICRILHSPLKHYQLSTENNTQISNKNSSMTWPNPRWPTFRYVYIPICIVCSIQPLKKKKVNKKIWWYYMGKLPWNRRI